MARFRSSAPIPANFRPESVTCCLQDGCCCSGGHSHLHTGSGGEGAAAAVASLYQEKSLPTGPLADSPYDPVVQAESPSPLQLRGRLSGPGLGRTPEGNPEVAGALPLTQDLPLRGGCKS